MDAYFDLRLRDRIFTWKRSGLSIVFTNGCFDLLHPGHIDYLKAAADLGDKLIIGLNDDASVKRLKGEGRPINAMEDRKILLEALRAVDLVIPFSKDTPLELITAISPDVLCKGGDYQVEEIVGHEHVLSYGGQVLSLPFKAGYSSSALIDRIRNLS